MKKEFYSKANDCQLLALKLKREFLDRIGYYTSTYHEVPNGKFLCNY